ncbi:DedA family protein [Saccharomonospora halophila]|uniref:DedA family protein n=1 Tax=Saccharomonospora halophila TaxID=129922 RepID=UPI00036F2DC2|nr:DedA family protein [Saccharomonospora halophila]
MFEHLLSLTEQLIASPWLYSVLFGLTALDGFFPAVPGETALVTVAVLAASDSGSGATLIPVVLAGASGAFVGDHVSYTIGRVTIGRSSARIRRSGRARAAYDWARRGIAERGGQVLLASRYVPGVRTATTISMGGVGYPLRSFSLFDASAAVLWAVGWSLVGYLGGAAFRTEPVTGLAFGLGSALALTLVAELVRRLRRRRAASSADIRDPAPEARS